MNQPITSEIIFQLIELLSSKGENKCVLFSDLFEQSSLVGLNNKDSLEELIRDLENKGLVAITTLQGDPDLIIGVEPM